MPTPKQYADALSSPSWTDRALPMEGRAAFLPFQDTLPGSVMNKRSLAIPGVFAGAINAITAPGRAYRGSDPTFNPQEEALNIGLNMMGGGMVASKVAPPPVGSLGIFAGSRAKTANMEALKVANEMKASGVADEAIHAKTGWTFGFPDGKPRFEIDDSGAKGQFTHLDAKNEKRVADQALAHPSLYKEYPELSKLSQYGFKAKKETGSFDPSLTDGKFTGNGLLIANAPNETGIKSVGLHELQHAIQDREGFAKGGSPEQFKNKRIPPKLKDVLFSRDMNEMAISLKLQKSGMGVGEGKYLSLNEPKNLSIAEELAKTDVDLAEYLTRFKDANLKLSKYPSAHTQYRNLAGEAEARLTQSRMNMTAPERAASYPPSMFDVPVKDQIVRYGDGQAMSVPPKFPQPDGELRSAIAQRNAALPISEGGLGLPADNMPMDRAKAMGFDTPAYHGTKSDIKEFNPSRGGEFGSGVYTAKYPETANMFASFASGDVGANVIPIVSRAKNPLVTDDRNIPRGLGIKGLIKKGFDSVDGIGVTGQQTQSVTFDPAMLRSRFAAFDPFRRHEADILAGVGIGGMLDPEFVSEEFRKKERK